MPNDQVKKLFKKVQAKEISVNKAIKALEELSYKDLGFAKVDLKREARCGFPEVVFCTGKTTAQIKDISSELAKKSKQNIILTRASPKIHKTLRNALPQAKYYPKAKMIVVESKKVEKRGKVAVVTAGTSDIEVAEEAGVTAEAMGAKVERIYDVGIAGVHRLLAHSKSLEKSQAIVAVAGMEGALPSLVSGLVSVPVVAVPTSTGYGASFKGIAALLTMLNSCAPGIAVVNIDNGFGAGYLAATINRQSTSNNK